MSRWTASTAALRSLKVSSWGDWPMRGAIRPGASERKGLQLTTASRASLLPLGSGPCYIHTLLVTSAGRALPKHCFGRAAAA